MRPAGCIGLWVVLIVAGQGQSAVAAPARLPGSEDGEPGAAAPRAAAGSSASDSAAAAETRPPPAATRPGGGAGAEAPRPRGKTTPGARAKALSHRMQAGFELGLGVGYSFLVTYRDATWCGKRDGGSNASFCTGLHPLHLDFGLSFGVHRSLDVLADFRLGLMDDPVGNRPLILMPGVRVWMDADRPFKIGIGFQLVLDFTQQDNPQQAIFGPPVAGDRLDLGGRIFAQFQYDFLRYVGVFAKIGAMATARKWVQVNLAGQIGVQARVP